MKQNKLLRAMSLAACAVGLTFAGTLSASWHEGWDKGYGYGKCCNRGEYKNVIVLIPDGTAQTVATLARWWKGEALAMDADFSGMVRTHMSNSVITGSAAAATAFASGHKTTVRFVGVGPRSEDVLTTEKIPDASMQYRPLASVLEAAKLKGKATGIISTSRITHATPAAYAAHIHDRGMDNELMEHLVYQDMDVVFGGGKRHLLPISEGGKRTDKENLVETLIARGYEFVETRDQLDNISSTRAWGMFASSHMTADVDRDELAPTQPSLEEMTSTAIEMLSQDKDGFFLMVEGSQVDWAGHANDPYYMLTDFIAFEKAYAAAVEFAKRNGNTLVIAVPDHNTGGMTIGHKDAMAPYTATTVEDLLGPLRKMHTSSTGMTYNVVTRYINDDLAAGISFEEALVSNVETHWGLQLSESDVEEIIALEASLGLGNALNTVVSKNHTVFGWTTYGHTGEDVPLWVYGSRKAYGVIDNTEIADITSKALGVNLSRANRSLFVDAKKAFPQATLDVTDSENPVLRIGNASLPTSKDILEINGETYNLRGLVVYAPKAPSDMALPEGAESGKVFIPRDAVKIIRRKASI